MRLQIGEGRGHRREDTEEQNGYLYNRRPAEPVVAETDFFLGGVERETCEREQHYLTQVLEPQRSVCFTHLLDGSFVHKSHCQHYA